MKNLQRVWLQILIICLLASQPMLHLKALEPEVFDLQAYGECNFITLSWNSVQKAEAYWIFRGTSKEKIHSMPLTDFPVKETMYIDKNDIVENQEYWYYITAVGSDNKEFARSGIVSATPVCKDTLSPPPCKLSLQYQVGNTTYWINHDSQGPMDTAPIILQSRMFLVIRYVTNAIEGTSIGWNNEERKVTIITRDGNRIELWIGKKDAKINGVSRQIDPNNAQVVPVIVDGRTLLPLRFVGENLGAKSVKDILWNASTQTVEILVDDPECEKEGFRYPKATPLKGNFYEFSVEYHTQKQEMPKEVLLGLVKSDNRRTLRAGSDPSSKTKMNLETVNTPKPTVEDIKTGFNKACRYTFCFELQPGILHFYRFAADRKVYLPPEGYFGPVYASMPGSERIENLEIEKIEDGKSLTIEGFFTAEPYPMLVNNYWDIRKQAETNTNSLLIQLDDKQRIDEGSFVSLRVQKRSTARKIPVLKLNKLLFEQKISRVSLQAKEVAMGPAFEAFRHQNRFAIIYTGCIDDAKVKDADGVKHVYERSRADFVGDMLNTYKICFAMGIPKNNIYVNFSRGDEEIDQICADDGDGNPFDFEWNDSEFRNTMERDAERWWRMDDGWRIRRGSRTALYESIAEINGKINLLDPTVTPEINLFLSVHGNVSGICSYGDGGIDYNNLIDQLSPLMENTGPSLHGRSKIRILNGTCKAGAILPIAEETFRTCGLDYCQIAASSRADELSWGQWPEAEVTSYASAGGTFGIAFRVSLDEQTSSNPDRQVEWEQAYDYAAIHDVYVSGVEHELDDGSTKMVYTHPQFWHSRSRALIQAGPAFEDPMKPEEEIRATRCRIGVDTSEAALDVCNCSLSSTIHEYPQSNLTIVNKGVLPFQVVGISADESVITKSSTHSAFVFRTYDWESCRTQSTIAVQLSYNESHTFSICLDNFILNAQPLDENGYMATEDNLPVFIQVPVTVTYQCGEDRFTQKAFVPLRVKGETYQMRFETSSKRSGSIKGDLTNWEELVTQSQITPVINGLPEGVIAGPANTGDFKISIKTDIFKKMNDQKISYDHLKAFKLEIFFDYTGESTDCIHYEGCGGGWVTSASIPKQIKNNTVVSYPETPCETKQTISIMISPVVHSREGYNSVIGKHTFRFQLKRKGYLFCDDSASIYQDMNLEIEVEFIDPD